MTTNTKVKQTKSRYHDRISLTAESLQRLSCWMNQIQSALKGSPISRSDLVNWFILFQKEKLSNNELSDLKTKFINPYKVLYRAALEIKKKQELGETVDAEKLFKETLAVSKTVSRSISPKKSKKSVNGNVNCEVESNIET